MSTGFSERRGPRARGSVSRGREHPGSASTRPTPQRSLQTTGAGQQQTCPPRQPGEPCRSSGWGIMQLGHCCCPDTPPGPWLRRDAGAQARSPRRPAGGPRLSAAPARRHPDSGGSAPVPPAYCHTPRGRPGPGPRGPRPQVSAPATQPGSAAAAHPGWAGSGAGGRRRGRAPRALSSCKRRVLSTEKSREAGNTTETTQDLRGWQVAPGGGVHPGVSRVLGTHGDTQRLLWMLVGGHARLGTPPLVGRSPPACFPSFGAEGLPNPHSRSPTL